MHKRILVVMTMGLLALAAFWCSNQGDVAAAASQTKTKAAKHKSKPTQTAKTATQTQTAPAHEHMHMEEAQPSGYDMPPYFETAEAAGPLPQTIDPATVPPIAQPAYQFARENPKLLAQLPCFCYCNRFGHTSLHSCYVDDHAQHCDVCLNETIDAAEMAKKGMSARDIRSAIIAKYHPKIAQ